jgi:hypothetical protein
MGGRPRGRPRGDRPRRPARPKQSGQGARKGEGQPKAAARGAGAAGAGAAGDGAARPSVGARAARALNPRKTPTTSRVGTAALLFGALGVLLGILGLTVNRAYIQPAGLTLLLAVLWGVRALMMR